MKLFILTIAKEQTYYSFDFEKDISVYKNIYTGVFNSRNKAETVAKEYLRIVLVKIFTCKKSSTRVHF